MSDTAYYEDQYEAAPQSGRWRSMFGGLAAAALSLTMLGGVVAWAYQISVRDAFEVPVVRAIEGPMKERPEDAGGLKLEETDLAVTRMVSGEGGAEETSLAPVSEAPAPEDKPVEKIREEIELATNPPETPAVETRLKEVAQGDEEIAVASLPPDAPAASRIEAPAEPESATGTPVAALGDATAQAPEASPLVRGRPADLDTSREADEPFEAASSTNTPVARQLIEIGVPVVQLGAFTSRQLAERVWGDQRITNRRLFEGMDATITTVMSGGRELYRLRVGPFETTDAAKKVCVVLKARGSDCIVTRSE